MPESPTTPGTLHAETSVDALPEPVVAPLPRIDEAIDDALGALGGRAGLPASLVAAMRYAALGPGKRARPLLCWHSFAAVASESDGGEGEGGAPDPAACLPAAVAVELVHAFSLVHDDLPGLDNDDLRRGRPTLHRHAGEAMAILAGDSLLTSAFQIIAERIPSLALQARLVHELALGTNGMIAGQVFDTLGHEGGGLPGGLDPRRRLELIHRSKTGMLIRAACRMGALCALEGRPGLGRFDALGAVTHYAEAIGLMFQVVDDLLDVTQSTEHLGKKSGKDQDAGKLTYPGVLGLEASRAEVRRLYDLSLGALEPLGAAAEPLRQLSTYMAVRTR